MQVVQTLTFGAASLASACDFFDALRPFGPTLVMEDGIYRVRVDLDATDRSIHRILDALETHVTAHAPGPARPELDGRRYLLDVADAASAPPDAV